jgi:cytochrome c5
VANQDSHFRNVFSAVIGILVAVALVLLGLARLLDRSTVDERRADDSLVRAGILERIQPVGRVAIAGQDNAALAMTAPIPAAETTAAAAPATGEPAPAAPTPATPEAAVPVAAAAPAADGKATYQSACSVCHGAGIAGAPKVGDKAGWAARIAQGTATLHQHALQGYQGQAGVMPAKGGRADLADEVVAAAVDYMVAESR